MLFWAQSDPPTVRRPPSWLLELRFSLLLPPQQSASAPWLHLGPAREGGRERESRRGLSALTDRCPRRRPLKREGAAAAAAVAAAAAAAAPDKHTFRGKESSSPLLFGELAFSSSPTLASAASSFADWTYVRARPRPSNGRRRAPHHRSLPILRAHTAM